MTTLLAFLKRGTRRRQLAWAKALESRIKAIAPPEIEVRATGWFPGCEPFWEWRRLEWVALSVDLGHGCGLMHHFYYPDAPSVTELGAVFARLVAQRDDALATAKH